MEKGAARRAEQTLLLELEQRVPCLEYHTSPPIRETSKFPYALCNQRLIIRNKYKSDVKFPLIEKLKYLLGVFLLFFCIVLEVFCLDMDPGNRETGKEGREPSGREGLNTTTKNFWPLATCTWYRVSRETTDSCLGLRKLKKKSVNSFNKYLVSIHYLWSSLLRGRDAKMVEDTFSLRRLQDQGEASK